MSWNPEQRPSPFLDSDQGARGKHRVNDHTEESVMVIELEEQRIAELELLRDQREILLEQMDEITQFLGELEQRIAELEQRAHPEGAPSLSPGH